MSSNLPKPLTTNLVPEALQAIKSVHRQDQRARYAMEVGAIGFVLLAGMSLFGGSPTASSPARGQTSGSYSPASSGSGAPALSPQQVQAIAAQSGATVVTPLSTEPIKVKPVLTQDEVSVTETKASPNDPFTFSGGRAGPRPMFVEDKKE